MMTADPEGLFPHPKGEQQALALPGDPPRENPLVRDLDLPQNFADASSFQVRDELEDLVRRDLLGPWDGEQEEFAPKAMGPRERYLVGMLGPKQREKTGKGTGDAAEVVEVDAPVQGDGREAELPEIVSPQKLGRMWASSMGLSFAVPGDVDVLAVQADWGRYDLRETEDDKGRASRVWYREPVSFTREVQLDEDDSYRIPLTEPDIDTPGVELAVDVRQRDGRRIVQLVLINAQMDAESNKDTGWLFQAGLTVTALDGEAAVFLPIDDPLDGVHGTVSDLEETHLRLLYREQRRYASGRNVAVHPAVRAGERCAHRLETTWLPVHNVPATMAMVDEGSKLAGVALSMDALATADVTALAAGLAPLAKGYAAWLEEEAKKIPELPEQLRPAAVAAIETANNAAKRIRAGITLLTDTGQARHGEALRAFRFANEAMAKQRRHSELARLREERSLTYAEATAAVQAKGIAAASWRPFQLAFVLLNLPSITDPAHPERAANADATVDLLFFPTGGGKTEAYLGLTAFTFAIRRLQGVVGSGTDARSGEAGVAVLMRYTLRLLTAQQFQRAAALVCAAEVMRRGDTQTWGNEPFRIGLWVGGSVSPNWFDEAAEKIAEAREAGDGKRTNVLQTLSCPWCGSKLRGHHDLEPRADERRVYLYCPQAEGADACPFARTVSSEGLPILTVDEEIYRYAPSLVIATVDKFAQLPWRGFAGLLFGRVRERCARHGYRHDDLDGRTGCGSRHNKKGSLPAVTSQPVVRLRPPDLIIQDEMHLISGALGTVVGLFEAAVDQLCTWPLPDGGAAGPKIVASTATTKRAREQVLGVFGRELAVFPPPVLDITDTFFSRQVPVTRNNPGRRYLGVCAHGVRMKSAQIRVAEILLLGGQALFDKYGKLADPYMTTVGYFSSTRELAGMRRILDDQIANRVRSHGRRKGLADRLTGVQMLNVQELTSRISSGDISEVLKRLEMGFDPEIDTSARNRAVLDDMRDAMKARTASHSKPNLHPVTERFYQRQNDGQVPVDTVLATSMLQVGVDVSRFGLMVVTGQPKNTAEYIQASSRVGRDAARPGLVITLYNWTRPRDLAHYEDFEYYHATFYRQVEALSVTPYTRRALDRGTTATFVAAVRNVQDGFSRNTDAYDVPLDGPEVAGVIERMKTRAEVIGGTRGRDYLLERIKVIRDLWEARKTGAVRLGYADGTYQQQQLAGLLTMAGGERWTDLTVGMSMRETENEVNLIVPAGEKLFDPLYNAPEWSFGPPPEGGPDDDDLPDGDELGESTLAGKEN
ncbi:helicase [Actinoplanes sp. ATCC 53533]|uniref:DISARM system helicase DrmA n=1 Tax=Actinoplanes sp. ATCC 53533 TaxID=1288362 RepID=UPI000F7927CB|nr:DISARM system helicase DrmA [Actinoplanes sp. ATCC 53533]RSM42414.1 helicase [Actinoplanes sp. ATCC 53533]